MLSMNDLLTGAQTLYKMVEDYKDNQKQLKILAEDIQATVAAVKAKKSDFFDSNNKDRLKDAKSDAGKALKLLKGCIEDAQKIVEDFKQPEQSDIAKFVKFLKELVGASANKDTIAEIYNNLNSAKQTLNLTVTLRMEECQKALQDSINQFGQQLATIEASNRESKLELSAQIKEEMGYVKVELTKLIASMAALVTSIAENSWAQPKGLHQELTITGDIKNSRVKALEVQGRPSPTLSELDSVSQPGFDRYQDMKKLEAENQKKLSQGIMQKVSAHTLIDSSVLGFSVVESSPSELPASSGVPSRVNPSASALTGSGSSATFASSTVSNSSALPSSTSGVTPSPFG